MSAGWGGKLKTLPLSCRFDFHPAPLQPGLSCNTYIIMESVRGDLTMVKAMQKTVERVGDRLLGRYKIDISGFKMDEEVTEEEED